MNTLPSPDIDPFAVSFTRRIIVAVAIGMVFGVATLLHLNLMAGGPLGYDFNLPWRAAHIVRAGADPYRVIRGVADFPFVGPYRYPMTATVVAWPMAGFTGNAAAATFIAFSTALLAFGLSRQSWDRLLILLSPSCLVSSFSGQWSTIMMAGTLLPWLSGIGICKPTSGLAVLVAQRSWRGFFWAIAGGLVVLGLSFVIRPTWLPEYLWLLRNDDLAGWYAPPASMWTVGGPLLLLSALRWRRPEGRFLLAVSITPSILTHYTAFYAMLVAETRREAMVLCVGSGIAWFGGEISGGQPLPTSIGHWIVPFVFLPALAIVLRRPNCAPIEKELKYPDRVHTISITLTH